MLDKHQSLLISSFLIAYRSYHYAIHHSGSRGWSGPFDVAPYIKRDLLLKVDLSTLVFRNVMNIRPSNSIVFLRQHTYSRDYNSGLSSLAIEKRGWLRSFTLLMWCLPSIGFRDGRFGRNEAGPVRCLTAGSSDTDLAKIRTNIWAKKNAGLNEENDPLF